MRGVPDDEGGENRQRDRKAGVERRRNEPAPQRRRGDNGQSDAHGEKRGGELRLQCQTEGRAERDQPTRLASAPELDKGGKTEGPEKDQRRVGGHENRANHDERHRDPHESRERGLFGRIEEAPGDQGDEGRHCADGKKRQRPHAEFRVAEQGGRRADEEGDHRRMVEISERKRARPEPVIGFVECKLEAARNDRLHGQERNRGSTGKKREPTGGARLCFSPRGGDDLGIAAHLVAFALPPPQPFRGVGRMRARFPSIFARRSQGAMANRENGARVLPRAHRRLAAGVV